MFKIEIKIRTNSCSDREIRFPVLNFQTPSTFPVTLKAQQDPQEPKMKFKEQICNLEMAEKQGGKKKR